MTTHNYNIKLFELKVTVPNNTTGFRNKDRDDEELSPYKTITFCNLKTNKKTKHDCYQEDILEDVERDVRLVAAGKVTGTGFYKHWMKLIFEEGNTYSLMRKEGMIINRYQGRFLGPDKYKENTFYFEINGEKVKAAGYYYEPNKDDRYEL